MKYQSLESEFLVLFNLFGSKGVPDILRHPLQESLEMLNVRLQRRLFVVCAFAKIN